jgi:hypothetical protein
MSIDPLLRQILQETQVVKKPIELAVQAAAERFWPDLAGKGVEEAAVEAAAFRKGTLHLVFDSQARMSEASAFLAESLREAINEELEKQQPPDTGKRATDGLSPASSRDAFYVTRLRFHSKGTY